MFVFNSCLSFFMIPPPPWCKICRKNFKRKLQFCIKVTCKSRKVQRTRKAVLSKKNFLFTSDMDSSRSYFFVSAILDFKKFLCNNRLFKLCSFWFYIHSTFFIYFCHLDQKSQSFLETCQSNNLERPHIIF